MVVEKYTHERAVQIEAQMRERGFSYVHRLQRRIDILRAAGLPIIPGPRPLYNGQVENNIYTFAEAALILLHPSLCWHSREVILKRGADRKVPWTLEAKRVYWAGVLTALALANDNGAEAWSECNAGRCSRLCEEL